ncbi:hypothetical protein [Methylomonas sp. MgM2]
MAELPPVACAVLVNVPELGTSERRIIAGRLAADKHQKYLNMMERLEAIFAKGFVAFPDPVRGQWHVLLDLLTVCVFHYNEETAKEIKSSQKEYLDNLKKIHTAVSELVKLLKIEEMKSHNCGISAKFDKDAAELMVSAAKNSCDTRKSCLFEWHIEPKIEPIIGRYDDKYFPSVAELISELSRQTANPEIIRYIEMPSQIHKKNVFIKKFFEILGQSISANQIAHEILELTNPEWCWLFNVATERTDFVEQDLLNHKP